MPEGISMAPAATPAPSPVADPLPKVSNSGYSIPMEVYAYFDLNNPKDLTSPELKRKLNNILAFAWEKTGGGELGDLLLAIREIENEVGAPDINAQRYDKIYNYITVQRQINDLEKQKRAMFNGRDIRKPEVNGSGEQGTRSEHIRKEGSAMAGKLPS